jgi:hypothetical protein
MANLLVARGASTAAKAKQRLEGSPWLPTAVGPEDELIEIDLELSAADSVVSAHKPILEVADHPVGERDDGLGALSQPEPGWLRPWDVLVACRGEPLEALEAVGVDRGPRRDVSGHEVTHRCPGEVRNDLHPDAARCTPPSLDSHEHQRCLSSPQLTATPKSSLSSANPRLIKLDLASEGLPGRVHHRSTELVKDHPCGLVAADPELALQEQGRETTLVRRHQVGGPEPRRERRLRVVENRPGRHRDLVTARGALPSTAASQGVGRLVSAPGTGEALWPAARGQVVRARFFAGELLLKQPEALRERRPAHPPTLPVVAC